MVLFRRFLTDLDVAYVDAPTITALVEKNFVHFNEGMLRKMIDQALKDRQKNMVNGVADEMVLGEWGEIMDAVRETTWLASGKTWCATSRCNLVQIALMTRPLKV